MEFKQAVVTQNGRTLMAKLLAGKSTQFTKIKVSSTIYPDAQLANLTALTNIKQETTAQAYGNNTATVSVVGAIENTGLQTGYYINTVGLYAMDPDKGEILYSVSSASKNGYMPPDTGVSKSGVELKIFTEVSNATNVNLSVDPAAYATRNDINQIRILMNEAEVNLFPNSLYNNSSFFRNAIIDTDFKHNGYNSLKIDLSDKEQTWATIHAVSQNKMVSDFHKGDSVSAAIDVFIPELPDETYSNRLCVVIEEFDTLENLYRTAFSENIYANTNVVGSWQTVRVDNYKIQKEETTNLHLAVLIKTTGKLWVSCPRVNLGQYAKPYQPNFSNEYVTKLEYQKVIGDIQNWIQAHS